MALALKKENAVANKKKSATTMVGVAGLEPAASWSRTMRDTKLRHTPKSLFIIETFTPGVKENLFPAPGFRCGETEDHSSSGGGRSSTSRVSTRRASASVTVTEKRSQVKWSPFWGKRSSISMAQPPMVLYSLSKSTGR